MIQFRPQLEGALYYSPGRDVAYAGPYVINFGVDYLKFWVQSRFPAFKEYVELHNITDQEIENAIEAFLKSLVEEIHSKQSEPLKTNSFSQIRFPVQLLVYGAICPLFIGEMLKGIKDITLLDRVYEIKVETFYEKSKPFIKAYSLCPKWFLSIVWRLERWIKGLSNLFKDIIFHGK